MSVPRPHLNIRFESGAGTYLPLSGAFGAKGETMEEERRIPRHVAVILDGNGRWAKAHHVPRKLGHKAGCENLEQVIVPADTIVDENAFAGCPNVTLVRK